MRRSAALLGSLGFGLVLSLFGGCSDDKGAALEGTDASGGSGGDASTSGTGGTIDIAGPAGPGGGTACSGGPDDDLDGDGYSPAQGDCNDCNKAMNPAAVEVVSDDPNVQPADENCNGTDDEPLEPCDDAIDIADFDPMSGAKAIELCQQVGADGKGWGVVSAAYVRADGQVAPQSPQVGILDGFGPNVAPRAGARFLGLSSGHARAIGQPNECGKISCEMVGAGVAPMGFPQDTPNCSGATEIFDDVALELKLKAPSNAKGYSFEFTFYSHEFPEWVCTSYNDQFIALVTPPPMGSINGNISFDSMSNPVSVNIAFFDVCEPNPQYPQFPCSLGSAELVGTGFDVWGGQGLKDAGATGWLKTTAPVDPGQEFTIRFAIWDTGDKLWDSTVILDKFAFEGDAGTVSVDTNPVPK
jgi:hypothetical protein